MGSAGHGSSHYRSIKTDRNIKPSAECTCNIHSWIEHKSGKCNTSCICSTCLCYVPLNNRHELTGRMFMSIEKGSIQALRPPTQTQTWYINIKCYIFSNLSFRNHSLLGGRLSLAGVSALHSLKENSCDFSVLTLMVQRKPPNPHKSSVQEVTSWKVMTGWQTTGLMLYR